MDGIIRSWNAGAERIYGYTAEEVVGKSVSILVPPGHPDELPQLLERVGRGERIAHYETVRVRKDREQIPIALTVSPIVDVQGRIAGVSTIARDITEQKQANEALRESYRQNEFLAQIVELASQPLVIGYPDGHLGLMNAAFAQLTGYTQDELKRVGWANDLTPPEWREFEQKKLEEQQRTGRPIRYEKEYIRKDGSRIPIELLVHLVTDSAGKPEYYYSFITDITERKRAEEALRKSEQEFRPSRRPCRRSFGPPGPMVGTSISINNGWITLG